MAEILVLKLDADDPQQASWIVVDSSGSRLGPPVTGPLSAAKVDVGGRRLIVLIPSLDVLTTSVDIPLKSQAKILQALPFALEEFVAEDVEDLHFAAGSRKANGRIPVSVISRAKLDELLEALDDAGLHPGAMIAENYGLASIPGTISLLVSNEAVYVNDGADTELVMQDLGPQEALEAIGALDEPDPDDDSPGLPRHVLIYCDADANETYAAQIEALRTQFDSLDVKLMPDGSLARLAVTVGSGAGVNLLQGSYGPKTEYAGYLRPWRYAAIALLAVGVVAVAGKAVGTLKLDRQEAELKERFLAEYREIAPGAEDVADPIAVISSLRARTGSGGGAPSVFLQSLEHLSAAIKANSEASIQAISYRAGVVDVRLTAPSVAMLDNIQRHIDEAGPFEADIQSTDQDEDQVNSRIQIRSSGS